MITSFSICLRDMQIRVVKGRSQEGVKTLYKSEVKEIVPSSRL